MQFTPSFCPECGHKWSADTCEHCGLPQDALTPSASPLLTGWRVPRVTWVVAGIAGLLAIWLMSSYSHNNAEQSAHNACEDRLDACESDKDDCESRRRGCESDKDDCESEKRRCESDKDDCESRLRWAQ